MAGEGAGVPDTGGAPVVIVGASHAGVQTAASLRQEGFSGRIVLIGDEAVLPYQKPPLSKAFIKEGVEDRLILRAEDFYPKSGIERIDGRVTRIDRAHREVELEDGRRVGYGHLVLAVGAQNRIPPLPGIALDGVIDLRTLADAARLRAALHAASAVAVIGGGFIGLEVAATAATLGRPVAVLEAMNRLMARTLSPQMSEHFLKAHRRFGVDVHLGTRAVAIEADAAGRAKGVRLEEGGFVPGDLVLVAVGVGPNMALAAEAGLETADGIVVDENLLTSDPVISAIGDCAAFPHRSSGAHLRLESVQNAVDQAKCVARRLVGTPAAYDALAWFWSDQGDQKLQIAGLTQGADRYVAHPSDDGQQMTVMAFRDDALIGVETANAAADHMAARKLLAAEHPVHLADIEAAGYDLRKLMRSGAIPR